MIKKITVGRIVVFNMKFRWENGFKILNSFWDINKKTFDSIKNMYKFY